MKTAEEVNVWHELKALRIGDISGNVSSDEWAKIDGMSNTFVRLQSGYFRIDGRMGALPKIEEIWKEQKIIEREIWDIIKSVKLRFKGSGSTKAQEILEDKKPLSREEQMINDADTQQLNIAGASIMLTEIEDNAEKWGLSKNEDGEERYYGYHFDTAYESFIEGVKWLAEKLNNQESAKLGIADVVGRSEQLVSVLKKVKGITIPDTDEGVEAMVKKYSN